MTCLQGRALELETRLRDKESEVEQLRRALAKAGIKQEEVPVRFDGVGAPPYSPSRHCSHCMFAQPSRQFHTPTELIRAWLMVSISRLLSVPKELLVPLCIRLGVW